MIADMRVGWDDQVPNRVRVRSYGSQIGDGVKIAALIEIVRHVLVGRNVKIDASAFPARDRTVSTYSEEPHFAP